MPNHWVDGKATLYGNVSAFLADESDVVSNHACSLDHVSDAWAQSRSVGFHTAPAAHILYNDQPVVSDHGWQCGRCIEVEGVSATTATGQVNVGSKVEVLVTDLCPGCVRGSPGCHCHDGSNHLDLSVPAFAALATTDSGVINVRWRYTPCTRNDAPGNAKLIIRSGAHRWNFQFAVVDVGGTAMVTGMAVKKDGVWKDADVAFGAAFGCANLPSSCGNVPEGPVEFKVVTTAGELTITVPSITPGTYEFPGNVS